MSQHNIGKIANLIGLTSEGIRYYERKGIIKQREDQNKPRTYDTWDLYFFARIKAYQNFGFSLDEITDVMNHYDPKEINDTLIEKEAILRKELEWKHAVLDHIEYTRKWHNEIQDHFDTIRIIEFEGMYRLPFENTYILENDKQTLDNAKVLFGLSPFVFASSRFKESDLAFENPSYTFGLTILERYKSFIPDIHTLEYIPRQTYISTIFESSSDTHFSKVKFQKALDSIDPTMFRICGDIITMVMGYHMDGSTKRNFHQALIPVCEIKDK